MGEIAESIIGGDFCQECGCWMGSGAGYPRSCKGCDPENGEDCEDPGAHEYPRSKTLRRANRSEAGDEFEQAQTLAEKNGMLMRKCSESHYQLKSECDNWLVNIYPGNRRLYHDKNRMGPYLKVPYDWGLLDVVIAASKKVRSKHD